MGSPPLTRGALHERSSSQATERITPAHAGSTEPFAHVGGEAMDHPRSRGEHERCDCSIPAPDRITPAHAGSTGRSPAPQQTRRDHPRSRGEHIVATPIIASIEGSPPLTRGAHPVGVGASPQPGITPAHAGSTPPPTLRGEHPADHPRSRGEHGKTGRWHDGPGGSPPLTRGARRTTARPTRPARITPAHAGSTMTSLRRIQPSSDHPRSRGEHSTPAFFRSFSMGSPPLTRGARGRFRGQRGRGGITPAHAGSTEDDLSHDRA